MVSETQNINLRLVLIVCSASVYERALIHERILFQLQFSSLLNYFFALFCLFFFYLVLNFHLRSLSVQMSLSFLSNIKLTLLFIAKLQWCLKSILLFIANYNDVWVDSFVYNSSYFWLKSKRFDQLLKNNASVKLISQTRTTLYSQISLTIYFEHWKNI